MAHHDFGSRIPDTAVHAVQVRFVGAHVRRDAKVDDHNIRVFGPRAVEDVLGLDVAVHDVMAVHMRHGLDKHMDRATCIVLGEAAAVEQAV